MTILAFDADRRTNAQAIVDAVALGWVGDRVLDITFGEGKFWTLHQPAGLVTSDLYKDAELSVDYLSWPTIDDRFETVVFDPPYKLQGTPSTAMRAMNESYGVERHRTETEVMTQLLVGALHSAHLVEPQGWLLVKCMDQICSNRIVPQTSTVIGTLTQLHNWRYQSCLHVVHNPQPQRTQVTPRNNVSTLLAFKKGGRPRA